MPMSKQLKNAIAKAGAFETFAREQSKRNRIANRMQGLDERMMRQQMRGIPQKVYRVNTTPPRDFTSEDDAWKYANAHSPYQPYETVNPRYTFPGDASAQYRQLQAQLANQDMNLADIRAMGDQRGIATSRAINDQYNQDLEILTGKRNAQENSRLIDKFSDDELYADENLEVDPYEYAYSQLQRSNPNFASAMERASKNWDYKAYDYGPYGAYWENVSSDWPAIKINDNLTPIMRRGYIPPEERGVPTPGYYEDLLGKARQDREAAFQRWLDMQQQPPRYR